MNIMEKVIFLFWRSLKKVFLEFPTYFNFLGFIISNQFNYCNVTPLICVCSRVYFLFFFFFYNYFLTDYEGWGGDDFRNVSIIWTKISSLLNCISFVHGRLSFCHFLFFIFWNQSVRPCLDVNIILNVLCSFWHPWLVETWETPTHSYSALYVHSNF